jgi:hypothetical protein
MIESPMKSTMRTPPQLHKPKRNRIKEKRKNKGKKATSTILPWRRRRALSPLQLLQMGTKQNNSRHASHTPKKKPFQFQNWTMWRHTKESSMQTWTGDSKEECKDVVVLVVVFLAPPSVRAGAGGGGLWREREREREKMEKRDGFP